MIFQLMYMENMVHCDFFETMMCVHIEMSNVNDQCECPPNVCVTLHTTLQQCVHYNSTSIKQPCNY